MCSMWNIQIKVYIARRCEPAGLVCSETLASIENQRVQLTVAKFFKSAWSTLHLVSAMMKPQKVGDCMTLGEKISSLRGAANMSQGDLAEKLNVSRQSISKWETDASVPELDKLIQLSGLFGITLDELVRSDELHQSTTQSEPTASPHYEPMQSQIIIQKSESVSTQKVIGFILLALGLLCCILALALGGGLVIIGGYIILCSILCLLVKKHAGLIIGWITLLQAVILTPYFTGVRIFSILNPGYYRHGLSWNHIVAIAIWVIFFVLVLLTARVIRRKKI